MSHSHRLKRAALALWLASVATLAAADGGLNNMLDRGLRAAPRSAEATAPAVIYTAARVVTMEPGQPAATAVAVAGKRIVAVGSLAAVKQALGQRAYTVDETFKGMSCCRASSTSTCTRSSAR